jgi:hypothetical protein
MMYDPVTKTSDGDRPLFRVVYSEVAVGLRVVGAAEQFVLQAK